MGGRSETSSTTNWREYITVDPHVCQGQVCGAGTRVPVTVILDTLATGLTTAEIAESDPSISVDAVHAALQCAAELASVNIARIVIRVIAWKRIHSSLWISLILFLAAPFSPVSDAACGRKRRAW